MNEYITYEDNALVKLLKEKPPLGEKAFEVLWSRYSTKLMQYCRLKCKCKDEADDLFQNTWIEFYNSAQKEKNITSLKGYLYKMAYRIFLRKIQDNKKMQVVKEDVFSLDEYKDLNAEFLEEYENREIIKYFYLTVDCLDTLGKEQLLMHWVAGLSFKEIAEIFEEQYDTVRMRCTRGMQKVISLMSPNLDIINK